MRVPVYQQQVATRALPSVRARAPQPGGAAQSLGAGLQDAGGSLGAIAARQQEQLNADRVFRAEAALKDEYREFETAQRDRRGQDAIGITDDVDGWFEEASTRYNESLENEAQRFMFGETIGRLRGSSLDAASQYESGQRAASLEDAAKSSIESSINTAAAQYNNPQAVADQKQAILKRIDVQAGFNGWTPERVKAEKEATLTRLHAGVVQAAVDADPEFAREYYAANKGEIAGTAHDDLKALLDTGTLRATAQRATDTIYAEGLSETDALKKAREDYEGEERDEIVTRLKRRYAEDAAATAEREKEVADEAWDIFARTGTVSSLPTVLLDELDGKTLQSLKNAESGDEAEDWNYFYTMLEDARSDPEAFATRDLRKDFSSLSTTQRGQVVKLQEELRNPDNLPDAATLTQQIAVARNLLELKDPEDKGKFEHAVRQAIAAGIQRKGDKLTYDERQKVIDRLMVQGEGMLWFDGPRFYEVAGTEDADAFVPEIPAADREQITDALRRNNVPVSEEAIVQAYRIQHGLF